MTDYGAKPAGCSRDKSCRLPAHADAPQRNAAKAGTPIIALIQHGALKSNSPNDSFWRRMAK